MTPSRISEFETKAHEDIHALLHVSYAYMAGRIDPPSSLHRLSFKDIAAHAKNHEIWAIGDPAIACVFLTSKSDAMYLGKLAVHPYQQGQKFARRLINLAADRARARGHTILELETRIELTETHAAFRKLGFRKVGEGRHAGFVRPTEIIMQRSV